MAGEANVPGGGIDHERLTAFAGRLGPLGTVQDVLEVFCSEVRHQCGATAVAVHVRGGATRVAPLDLHEMAALDDLQYRAGSGPGVEVLEGAAEVVVPDLEQERSRWPDVCDTLLAVGIHGVAALPVGEDSSAFGVVTLYSVPVRCWTPAELGVVRLLSVMVANHLTWRELVDIEHQVVEQLQHALDARVVIEQAKGALAAVQSIGVDEAFERIRGVARRSQSSTQVVAESVVAGLQRHPSTSGETAAEAKGSPGARHG